MCMYAYKQRKNHSHTADANVVLDVALQAVICMHVCMYVCMYTCKERTIISLLTLM